MSLVSAPPSKSLVHEPGFATRTASEVTVWTRVRDYIELTKPKIAVMALLTVTLGFALAAAQLDLPAAGWSQLAHALWGIALVASASSAWNQLIETRIDARMVRTCRRPLPAGRLTKWEVALFGIVCSVVGVVWLAWYVNLLTAGLSLATLVLYAGVYTPLKRYTTLNTVVGAIPGALPPVLGWTAAGAGLDAGAFALFAILFLWQFPHFMAIAWLYRQDYAHAGLKMIPVHDATGWKTGVTAIGYALALLPVSWLPSQLGLAGTGYWGAASILGVWYIVSSVQFLRTKSSQAARRLLWTSIVYLPALLGALVWDRYQLLS